MKTALLNISFSRRIC